jgi:Family of unknown function (DUF5519)
MTSGNGRRLVQAGPRQPGREYMLPFPVKLWSRLTRVLKARANGGSVHRGYWRMTKIRVKHNLSSNDLYDASSFPDFGPSYLGAPLPKRSGSPPKIISRTMPQRQHPEPIPPSTSTSLQTLMSRIASVHPSLLEVKPSHTEGLSTDGLYAKDGVATRNANAHDKILGNEIAHAHPADNSLHVWLSDRDAKQVVEKGWGMRFPLTFVHPGWTMVFAPRSEEELAVVERIVEAGVGWVCGVEI